MFSWELIFAVLCSSSKEVAHFIFNFYCTVCWATVSFKKCGIETPLQMVFLQMKLFCQPNALNCCTLEIFCVLYNVLSARQTTVGEIVIFPIQILILRRLPTLTFRALATCSFHPILTAAFFWWTTDVLGAPMSTNVTATPEARTNTNSVPTLLPAILYEWEKSFPLLAGLQSRRFLPEGCFEINIDHESREQFWTREYSFSLRRAFKMAAGRAWSLLSKHSPHKNHLLCRLLVSHKTIQKSCET